MGYKGRIDLSTALAFNIETNEIHQLLTPGDGIYLGQSGLGHIVGISPDKEYAYMPAYVAKSKSDQSPNYSLVKTRLGKKSTPSVVRTGKNYTSDYFVDSNGKVIAEERYNNRNNTLSVLAKHGDKWKIIFEQEEEIRDLSIVGVTADSESLVVLDESAGEGRVAYFTMSLADGSFAGPLFERPNADIEYVLTNINRVVFGVAYSGFTPSYHFFNPSIQKRADELLKQFPNQSVWIKDWTEDWGNIVIYVEGSNYIGEYFSWHKGKLTLIAKSRQNIGLDDLNPVSITQIKARDGLIIPTLVTIPHDKLNTLNNLPAIMLPHGGPASYDRMGFDWLAQAFANEGYVVIQPQFRGSRGFGPEHESAGFGEWGKKMQSDLTDSLGPFIKEGIIDPKRICIVGASYGGYAALAGGAFTPEIYKCVVSINGVSDLTQMMKEEKSDHGRNHWVLSYWQQVMANNKTDPDILVNSSPAQFADQFKASVLLLHGERDSVVNINQSKYMYKKLKKAKKTVSFVKLKGDNHYLSDGENRKSAIAEIVKFVNKNIGKSK